MSDEPVVIQVADGVRDAVEGGVAGLDSVTRALTPKVQPEHITNETDVHVVPGPVRRRDHTRKEDMHMHDVDVAVFSRVVDKAERDELMGVAEDIYDFVDDLELPDVHGAYAFDRNWDPIYSQQHLREQGIFASVITVTMRLVR